MDIAIPVQVCQGDARHIPLPDESVQCVVTSPPYWGLRSYGVGTENGEIGLEPTPELYVEHMVEVFREVRRVLRRDGTVWLNLGDSYASGEIGRHDSIQGREIDGKRVTSKASTRQQARLKSGLKPKDLVGIPWRVAFALQADGWWLRSDIVWCLAPETEIMTESGNVAIRDIHVGMRVWDGQAWNPIIRKASRHHWQRAVRLTFDDGYQVTCSPSHRWPMKWRDIDQDGDGCLCAGDIVEGEEIRAIDGVRIVTRTEQINYSGEMIDIALAFEPHLFALASGILTHNSKPNPMPESVTDRPTKAHEYLFLLTKSARYYFDQEAVREAKAATTVADMRENRNGQRRDRAYPGAPSMGGTNLGGPSGGRNIRSVWTIAAQPFSGAHFATMPPALVEPCIKAGTSERGACPACGSPWERVVEKGYKPGNQRKGANPYTGPMERPGANGQDHSQFVKVRFGDSESTTLGWRPTCSCYDHEHCVSCGIYLDDYERQYADALDCGHNMCSTCLLEGAALDHKCDMAPMPCLCLDPFGGAGTVGLVAMQLGRRAVLLDLSADYCRDIAWPRLHPGVSAPVETEPLEMLPMFAK